MSQVCEKKCVATKLRKGDKVKVITGKSKGKQGIILSILRDKQAVVVEGVNIMKKHMKPNPAKDIQGGIVERERPIHISNVAIVNAASGEADRVGYKLLEDGKKVRVYRSNGEQIAAQ